METYPHQTDSILERFNKWLEESITIKLLSIGFLVLILLIPSTWIQNLMEERQSRADEVINEVSSKWSGTQTLSGPILVVPYKVQKKITQQNGTVEIHDYTQKYYFLPETLEIDGKVDPEILHRGLFDAAVYESSLKVKANFGKPDFKTLGVPEESVIWSDAHMIFSVTDLRGISDNPSFLIGDKPKLTEPSSNLGISVKKFSPESSSGFTPPVLFEGNNKSSTGGIIAKLEWKSGEDFVGNTSVDLKLKGSQRLNFLPTGKTTTVNINSSWTTPSFEGEFLPASREISDEGFTANWKILHYNRPFAQQWTNSDEELTGSEFGVKLLVPVDQYQKSIRTSKYGKLIIILTFVALVLVEITKKIRIHPFQYILIGVALIIYYTLLLSFSEQVGYNTAYWIATLSTVLMVTLYSKSFLKGNELVIMFASLLTIFYSFIFVIILQQDFALIIGSIGLFLIVSALMYFSRKVQWYAN